MPSKRKIPKEKQTDVVSAIVEDVDKYRSLKAIFDQEGGQILIDALIADVVLSINRLDGYADMSRDELVSVAARLSTSLNLARTLTRSEQNASLAEEALDSALRE